MERRNTKTLFQQIMEINSKLRYGLALTTNCLNPEDLAIKKLHSLHRAAMRASLFLTNKEHPSDKDHLEKTGQKSVLEMATAATANMAWKAGQDWRENPLTSGRTEEHRGQKTTRQLLQRTLPPQSIPVESSLVSRLAELWEKLPNEIKTERKELSAKEKISQWAAKQSTKYIN